MICKERLEKFLLHNNLPAYRAKQILHAIYKEGKSDFHDIKVLPKSLQDFLAEKIPIFSFETVFDTIAQNGDTTKTLFQLRDGAAIEGVLMRFSDGRNSVCVSSQAGCGLKCAFCATGTMGFKRNLACEEIADQVLYFSQKLNKENKRVTHVVFMGMGEPFLNYENVMQAAAILNDPDCMGIAARHVTISTSGIVPGIQKFAEEKLQINLAVSLHAPNQALREKLMPIAKSYDFSALMSAIKSYTRKTHRRVSYEYVMLKGINDSDSCARQLAVLLKGTLCHINLIPYNETYLGFQNAGKTRIDGFRKILESQKLPVTVRVSLGQKEKAACGQLVIGHCIPCIRR